MREEKLITIAVSIYNTEISYLRYCLDSIERQKSNDYLVILVDDGSENGVNKVCDTYAENNSVFKVIHKENGGASSARNAALEICKTKWITFIDSDDYIEENFVVDLCSNLKKYDPEILFFNTVFHHDNKKPQDVCFYPGNARLISTDDINQLKIQMICPGYLNTYKPIEGQVGGTWGKVYNVDFLNNRGLRYIESMRMFEDPLFNFRAFSYANTIYYYPKYLYHYRIWNGSICRNNPVNYIERYVNAYEYTKNIFSSMNADNCYIEALTVRTIKTFNTLLRQASLINFDCFNDTFIKIRPTISMLDTKPISNKLEILIINLIIKNHPIMLYFICMLLSKRRIIKENKK